MMIICKRYLAQFLQHNACNSSSPSTLDYDLRVTERCLLLVQVYQLSEIPNLDLTWNLGRLYRRPLFKHIFITLEEGSVCKNSFKNAILAILQCIILLDSLDFYLPRSKYLRNWGSLVNLELSEQGNSMAVVGLRWPRERKTHEI